MWLEVILLLLFLVFLWQIFKRPPNYPPGPWGFPLIGSLPRSIDDYNKKILALHKKYGGIVSWRIGTRRIVSLLDFNLLREAFQSPDMSNRPDFKIVTYLQGDHPIVLGIITSVGHLWQNNRRFALKYLRDLVMSKPKLYEVAHYEADFVVQELKKQAGRSAVISHSLTIAILNVIWQMVGSKRYDLDDEEIERYCQLACEVQLNSAKLVVLDVFPWVKKIIPKFILNYLFKMHVQSRLSDNIKQYFKKSIDEHELDLDEQNPRDYIDGCLIEIKKQGQNSDSTMSIDNLIFCLSDLFETGTETVNNTVRWTLLYLAKFQHVQRRLQKEIDEVIPKGVDVTPEDISRLPYTEAFIHEALRHSSVGLTPPRETSCEVTLGGYTIPKGTVILGQILMMHLDSKYFDSAEEFRPERFLDSDGNFVTPKDGYAPFGYGRRICIGETLARAELFVFVTKFVQHLHFAFPPGEEHTLEASDNPIIRSSKGNPKFLISLR